METTSNLFFQDLDNVESFVDDLITDCNTNLPSCVSSTIEEYNEKHKPHPILQHSEKPLILYEVADAVQTCISNEQTDCICEIPDLPEGQINLYNDGTLEVIEDEKMYKINLGVGLANTYKSKLLVLGLVIEDDGYRIGSIGNLFSSKNGTLGLTKYDREYYWTPINNETKHLLCRNNKNNYRFQSVLSSDYTPLDFSVYLEDTVAPELDLMFPKQKTCGGQESLLFEWSMALDDDPAYEFIIEMAESSAPQDIYDFSVLENTAEPLSGGPESISKLNTLYVKSSEGKQTYYYMVGSLEGIPLVINSTYNYKVNLIDHFNNSYSPSNWFTITIKQPLEQAILLDLIGINPSNPLIQQFIQGSTTCELPTPTTLTVQQLITGSSYQSVFRGGNENNVDSFSVIKQFGLPYSERYHDIDKVVVHYTVTYDAQSTYNILLQEKLSYHYVIDHDGQIYQFVPEDKSAWHAGCGSSLKDGCLPGYNSRSIGISFVNCGYRGGGNTCVFNEACYVPSEPSGYDCWQPYSLKQLDSLAKLLADIDYRIDTFVINEESIVRHSDINVQKADPGPAFDEEATINKALFYLNLKYNEPEVPET